MYIQHISPASVTTVNDALSLPPVTQPLSPELINISASGLADQNCGCGIDLSVVLEPPMTVPRWQRVGRVVPSMDAVVKVFCVHTAPNFSLPWQRKKQYSSSSSGLVIGGRRILTDAHSVDHHTQVKLKKRGSNTKYLATVSFQGSRLKVIRHS